MFLTNIIIIALVVIAISTNCLAEHLGLHPYLNKQYKLLSSDDTFARVLKELGMGSLQRTLNENAVTRLTLTWDSETDLYNLLVRSNLTFNEDIFKIGVPYDLRTVDGREVLALFRLQGSTLIHTQKQHGRPDFVIRWTFCPDNVIVKTQIKDIISYRTYGSVTK